MRAEKETDLSKRLEQMTNAQNMKVKEDHEISKMFDENDRKLITNEAEYKSKIQKLGKQRDSRVRNHQEYLRNDDARKSYDIDKLQNKYFNEKLKQDDKKMQDSLQKHMNDTMNNFNIVKQQLDLKELERVKDAEILRKSIQLR